jgi:hypothetical protein
MPPVKKLLEKSPDLSAASKYTAFNGVIYVAAGALLIVWPAATQTIFNDRASAGDEGGLKRTTGTPVAVMAWLYLFGGCSGARQTIVASVFDRLTLVPPVLYLSSLPAYSHICFWPLRFSTRPSPPASLGAVRSDNLK